MKRNDAFFFFSFSQAGGEKECEADEPCLNTHMKACYGRKRRKRKSIMWHMLFSFCPLTFLV